MARVFLIEKPEYCSTASLKEFGDTVFLFERRNEYLQTKSPIRIIKNHLRFHNFDPEEDYVCIAGSIFGTSLLISACLLNADGPIKVLVYSGKNSRYYCRSLQGN